MGCGGSKNADANGSVESSASADIVKVTLTLFFPDSQATGDVVVDVHNEWAPLGSKRFLDLVDDGYMDGLKIYRVVPGFMGQWGIHGDTKRYDLWKDKKLDDDAVKAKNTKGRLSFATSGPNCRSCQIFVNFGDNRDLDKQGFSPFGEVNSGIEYVDKIYSGYGESEPSGKGPNQTSVKAEGDKYLSKFPLLTTIQTAKRS